MEEPMNDLRRIRIDKRISQFDLSLKSRVHPSRISLIENNRTTPTGSEMNRISDALGILPEEVFGLDTVMRRLMPVERRSEK
jgi:transcriptional regulator with XRE-family HTH domain